jgi:hypothetical protein
VHVLPVSDTYLYSINIGIIWKNWYYQKKNKGKIPGPEGICQSGKMSKFRCKGEVGIIQVWHKERLRSKVWLKWESARPAVQGPEFKPSIIHTHTHTHTQKIVSSLSKSWHSPTKRSNNVIITVKTTFNSLLKTTCECIGQQHSSFT